MRILLLLLAASALVLGQVRDGNFGIRFEPQVDLQANADVPFAIAVKDDLHRPLTQAKVTLQIETAQGTDVALFRATATEPGMYIAKVRFPAGGQWSVYVQVQRGDQISARTIDFTVPENAHP